jgi:hypothetical protein
MKSVSDIPIRSRKRKLHARIVAPLAGAALGLWVGCSYFRSSETASKPWVQNYEGYSTNHTMLEPGTLFYGK